jgi:hypothetical protein
MGRRLPSGRAAWIPILGDPSHDDVAIGNDSRQLLPIENGQGTNIFRGHQLRGL